MELKKRRYVKLANDPTSPIFAEQLKIDILHEELWDIEANYNHRIHGLPPPTRMSAICQEISLLHEVILDKFRDDSLWIEYETI